MKKKIKQWKAIRKATRFAREMPCIRVDVGSGNKAGREEWVTIDMTKKCDIFWDLRRGIPFPNSTVDTVYSSHFMEHLSYSEGQVFIKESFRVLKPGGEFSVCVPNTKIYVEAYLDCSQEKRDFLLRYKPAVNQTTDIDLLNYIGYMSGQHKYMFDPENLLHVIGRGGFIDARLRDFVPEIDHPDRVYESIYAVAYKPR